MASKVCRSALNPIWSFHPPPYKSNRNVYGDPAILLDLKVDLRLVDQIVDFWQVD